MGIVVYAGVSVFGALGIICCESAIDETYVKSLTQTNT